MAPGLSMNISRVISTALRRFTRLLGNLHFWIIVIMFAGSIFLLYPQYMPFLNIEPESFLFLTRHSVGRLILLLPITYTALVFGLRAGILGLIASLAIMIPDVFIIREIGEILPDDLIEIIAIFVIGLVVNFWLESYFVDRKHRQQAIVKLERAQRELEKMQQNLRFYLKQITLAQEEERKRIAQELHDDTAQDLVVLSRHIDAFISRARNLTEEESGYLESLRQQTNKTLSEVRRFSQDLRPSVLDDLGLLPALEWLIPELYQHFGIRVEMKVTGKPQRFPKETELVLFRIAQESLRNAGKHSEATQIQLTISFSSARTIMSIKDNGKGFSVPESVGDLAASGKLGLVGMEERVRLIGGKIRVISKPGAGTTIKVEVPGQPGLPKTA